MKKAITFIVSIALIANTSVALAGGHKSNRAGNPDSAAAKQKNLSNNGNSKNRNAAGQRSDDAYSADEPAKAKEKDKDKDKDKDKSDKAMGSEQSQEMRDRRDERKDIQEDYRAEREPGQEGNQAAGKPAKKPWYKFWE